jgi:hypothetical protein
MPLFHRLYLRYRSHAAGNISLARFMHKYGNTTAAAISSTPNAMRFAALFIIF